MNLGHVLPIFATDNVRDDRLINAVLGSQLPLTNTQWWQRIALDGAPAWRTVALANLGYLFFGEFGNSVPRTARALPKGGCPRRSQPASFSPHVAVVIGSSSDKEMIRAHAKAHIAPVTDHQAIRDWPDETFIRNSVRESGSTTWRNAHDSVPGALKTPSPQPTGTRLFNVRHQPVADRSSHTSIVLETVTP